MSSKVWVEGFDEIVMLFDNYRAANKHLDSLADELNSICIRETQNFSPDPVGGSCEIPELQRYIEHRDMVRQRMMKQLAKIGDLADRVLDLASHLGGYESLVVWNYYINGHSMRKISIKINYSVRRCWEIRDMAIYKLAKECTLPHTNL